MLRLMFTACHPVLSVDARVALTLKLVAGLSTEAIARAFVVPTTTMAARITRAKQALTRAGVPFEVPVGDDLAERLESVLEVVYLVFNEGYTATAGPHWMRAELCREAMRLGRMLAALASDESEAHALVALMELQASRLPARTSPGGGIVTARPTGSDALGPRPHRPRSGRPGPGGGARAAGARMASRPGSRRVTPGRRAPRTRTGCASRPCTASWWH